MPIVEDDPYGELAQSDAPPLIARGSDDVIYLSSFSKTIAPSLRLGWMAAPRTIYDRLLLRKQSYDMATRMYIQAGVDDFMRAPTTRTFARCARNSPSGARSRTRRSPPFGRRRFASTRRPTATTLGERAARASRSRAACRIAERRGVSFLFGEPFFAQSGGDHHFRLALTPRSARCDR